jgi:hypothetical protein
MEFNKKEIFKLFISSLNDARKWSLWKWLMFSSIGALSGTLQFGEKFFELDQKRSFYYGIYAILGLYIIRFVPIFTQKSLKYYHEIYKNSTYGDAIILLKDCFAEVHYFRKTDEFKEDEFMKSMMNFCDNLKKIFDKITQSECSVSIKVPVKDSKVVETTQLKNLTRDNSNKNRDTSEYSKIKHTIIGNTAFNNTLNKVITNKSDKFYINNSVNKTQNYLNTSKSCYPEEILPYNSELVHSISPKKSLDSKNFDCHGFLCVDSKNENAFDNKYCPAILEGVCDGIYDLILELNENYNNI